jgi:hypothetical protein
VIHSALGGNSRRGRKGLECDDGNESTKGLRDSVAEVWKGVIRGFVDCRLPVSHRWRR